LWWFLFVMGTSIHSDRVHSHSSFCSVIQLLLFLSLRFPCYGPFAT
jgi:hypothetical protein